MGVERSEAAEPFPISVTTMSRPVPPQVIPRPPTWRPGEPAPWADAPRSHRTGIRIDRVLGALAAVGQHGPVPEDIGSDRVLVPAFLVNESSAPVLRQVNAGVLAVMFEEHGETRLILTRRSSAMRTHKGEVSFPGGRLDEGEDPVGAALREAFEEVALDPALVEVVGWIHPVLTMSSESLIMPVLATVATRPHVVASPDEVERVFDVSLAELADPAIFHEERWSIPGRVIPGTDDDSFAVWFFEVAGEIIWGATARMIHELLSVVLTGTNGI
jgi:8-oxo-dGTP pyrophosphatase MutT (NUDIX family)